MRTINQLSKLAKVRTSPYMSFNTITGTEVFVHVSTDELRHLIAIAKAAKADYDKTPGVWTLSDVAVEEAERSGLFGGGK